MSAVGGRLTPSGGPVQCLATQFRPASAGGTVGCGPSPSSFGAFHSEIRVGGGRAGQTGSGGTAGNAGAGALTVAGSGTVDLTATKTYTGPTTVDAGTLLVDVPIAGSAITINTGGTLAPGNSPGQLTVNGDLSFAGGYAEQIGGTTAGTGYDQTVVPGTVNLTGGTLNLQLYGDVTPTIGDSFTIIDDTGGGAVAGAFTGLAQGATVNVGGYGFVISYTGGPATT